MVLLKKLQSANLSCERDLKDSNLEINFLTIKVVLN